MPKILEPKGAEIFALKAFLLKKQGPDREKLSFIFDQPCTDEICLDPAKARDLNRVCRELAQQLTALANQAQGVKFC